MMDWLGISLSSLCLVHCLLLPPFLAILTLLTLSPIPGWMRETEWVHAISLIPVVLVSGPVLLGGAKRDPRIGWFAVLAFGGLFSALFVHSVIAEQALTVFGAIVLVLAHWLNLKARSFE